MAGDELLVIKGFGSVFTGFTSSMYSKVGEISADMSVFNCLHEDIQTSSHETSEYFVLKLSLWLDLKLY